MGVIGRDLYGVFPLKGKPLNVREASHAAIMKNEEVQNVVKIMGLRFGTKYDRSNISTLRYGHLMIMTDQDHDGSHIKGLLINCFHHFWPSLLQIPGFLRCFITPIVKATVRRPARDVSAEMGSRRRRGCRADIPRRRGRGAAAAAARIFRGAGSTRRRGGPTRIVRGDASRRRVAAPSRLRDARPVARRGGASPPCRAPRGRERGSTEHRTFGARAAGPRVAAPDGTRIIPWTRRGAAAGRDADIPWTRRGAAAAST